MTKRITISVLLLCFVMGAQAQKKKDLIEKVALLESNVSALSDSLARITRKANADSSRVVLLEQENLELRDANQTLLKNLTSFSKVSKQSTETVNKALASLKEKEDQLSVITDTFSKNDSIAITILTQAKQTLGPEAKVGVSNGSVLISNSLDDLFGSDSGTTLTETAQLFLDQVGQIIAANPDRAVLLEGLNITGEFDLTYQQVLAVASALAKVEGVGPERLRLLAKDGNFKEGILIRLAPDSKKFYNMVKTEFK